ncbi:SIMPL domain-containing protein [Porticoccus sp. W117]|uniref:SIMPL domain-containing protein n=1 Tax=Porticoccus sp. W117 TaxID=3054777 RepID=UPI00259892FA|nr:SIMPL domain-containing protein [Porticoccus sp. W117]MDM3870949.1 SIMPL domain-containing protein [Porticoccus sp. W117]
MKKLLIAFSLILPMLAVADQYDRRLIHTNGYGEVKVKPDMAKLVLSVSVQRKKALDAKSEADKRVNDLLAGLKKHGLKSKDVIASGVRTQPRFEYSKLSSKRTFIGYTATRDLTITIKNLDKLTDIMDLALSHNIENINQVRYESSQADKHINQARKNAIENSKQKAAALANAYGAELGNIVNIQYHSRQANFGLEQHMEGRHAARAMSLMADSVSSATYLPDEITFSDNIQVTFDLIVNN